MKYELGKVLYRVITEFMSQRVRLTMTDAEGNVWYRYKEPMRRNFVEEVKITGMSWNTQEGEPVDYDNENVYQVRTLAPDGTLTNRSNIYCQNEVENGKFFDNLEDAENLVKELNAADKEKGIDSFYVENK